MATYNGERFLREQLESFSRQTRLPDELVVTDDCSTDETVNRVREFARTALFPVRLEQNAENLGFARNFEKAVSLCSGEIVFLSDQDDVWFPNKLATVARYFDDDQSTQVIINDALLADERLNSTGHTQRGNIANAANAEKIFSHGCCSAHRQSWRDLALPLPEGMAHDYWINGLAIALACARQVPDALQLYRRHGGNAVDWALSDPHGVSFIGGLRLSGLSDARQSWSEQRRFLHTVLDRLAERAQTQLGQSLAPQIPRLLQEIAALEKRIEICSVPRRKRSFQVARFWAKGGYAMAAGWKSAVKDLIRP